MSKKIQNPYKKRILSTTANSNQSFAKRQAISQTTVPSFSSNELSSTEQESLEQTLNKHFGFQTFRPGQISIIQTLLKKRDAAVFWSTGSGKSLCYQIPALHTGKIALIVSPLISLMEDQVAKLNGVVSTGGGNEDKKDIAVFLGTGQKDQFAERKAVNGEYKLIYCTPEKLASGGGSFLNQMGNLHTRNTGVDGLCLIAVDESHCVSEWGHDFRPQYRQIGDLLRNHNVLKTVPIVALTATAVPRVQTDIISSLHMRNPNIVKQSFDRDNLIISVKRKPAGGYRSALKTFVNEVKKMKVPANAARRHSSTIIYCPTQSQVEEVAEWLSMALESTGVRVQSYHGGQGIEHRSDAHINFLTGKTSIIVATLAFGMGIDKVDTRRIIHFGPPKTVEEYYQQIGRAGRDGLEAHCEMYCNNADFDRYKSDFYLGRLSSTARANTEMSIESLRAYGMNEEVCRRAELLKFFKEDPSFGERCGTCDTCVTRLKHSDDIERDFAPSGARLMLYVISILNSKQGTTVLEKILKGTTVEPYRFKSAFINQDAVQKKVHGMRSQIKYRKRVPVSYFTKDLLPCLVSRGFVAVENHCGSINDRTTRWAGYKLSPNGFRAVNSGPIMLPVPASVREYERAQEAKIQKSLEDLKKVGADIEQIPKHEIEEGDGKVFKALRTWYNYLDLLQRNERTERIDALEDLRLRIDAWRMDVADKYRIAPADALPDHLLLSVAYAAASIKDGNMEKDALLAVGVRSGGIAKLNIAINEWIDENRDKSVEVAKASEAASCVMNLPNELLQPKKAWDHFVYKPRKNTGLATWESSYNRFMAGEHPQAIAIAPLSGRPIQVNTVIGHIFDGMLSGRAVNLKRIAAIMNPPTESEWDILSRMESQTEIDVKGDPKTSGKNGEVVRMGDFLGPIMGEEFTAKEYSDRTPQEQADFSKWCNLFRWYATLTRIGYKPTFGT